MRRCLQALDDHVRLGEALIAVVGQRRTPPAPVLGQPVTRWRVAFAHGTAFAWGVRVDAWGAVRGAPCVGRCASGTCVGRRAGDVLARVRHYYLGIIHV